jgi:signal peptidase II
LHKKSIWLLPVIILLLAADQLTKYIVRQTLVPGESLHVLLFFKVDHIQNRGMAFGLFGDHGGLILFVGTMVVLMLIVASLATRGDHEVFWPLALLVAGSAGNLIDRFARGSVTDFIHFPYWPAFNLADIFIVVGVLLLIRALLTMPRKVPAQD